MSEKLLFIKYILKDKPIEGFKNFIRKPTNFYFILLFFLIYQIITEAIKHDFNFSEINFSIYWFLVYIVGIFLILIYKEFEAGEWKHFYREKRKSTLRKSK